MSELRGVIEKAYDMAKSGHWDRLMSDWEALCRFVWNRPASFC